MSHDPFRNYDAWLEAPFQRMCVQQEAEYEAFIAWCDDNDIDPEPFLESDDYPQAWLDHVAEQDRLESESDEAQYQAWYSDMLAWRDSHREVWDPYLVKLNERQASLGRRVVGDDNPAYIEDCMRTTTMSEGQDRESYTDDQDRESYTVTYRCRSRECGNEVDEPGTRCDECMTLVYAFDPHSLNEWHYVCDASEDPVECNPDGDQCDNCGGPWVIDSFGEMQPEAFVVVRSPLEAQCTCGATYPIVLKPTYEVIF